jgi:magnesium-transporting ATPase (P-type)
MNVIEDMSRISHIFCDKTGTLTKNELLFSKVVCNDLQVKDIASYKLLDIHFDFWRCINLCHEVSEIDIDGKKTFSGSSPDEVTFITKAAELKNDLDQRCLYLKERTDKTLTLQFAVG